MRVVYRFHIGKNGILEELCKASNDLYNQSMYVFVSNLKETGEWLSGYDLDKIMKSVKNKDGEINYRRLKAQCSQNVLKDLNFDIQSYLRALRDYKKHPEKYTEKPGFPRYKKSGSLNRIVYPNQSCRIRNGFLILDKDLKIEIPQWNVYNDRISGFKQVVVTPLYDNTYNIEIVYEVNDVNISNNNRKYASIDIGINNLITMITEFGVFIFKGGFIKSKNRIINKTIANLKSIKSKQGIKYTTKNIKRIYNERDLFIDDAFHKISRSIANFLYDNGINTLVIGYNKEWKQNSNMGKIGNQRFSYIPFLKLIEKIEYKCKLFGIEVIRTEESYTSKCDSLAREDIRKHDIYLGKRKKRGIFVSSVGYAINADVNGALNILRKVVGESSVIDKIADIGILSNPISIKSPFNEDLNLSNRLKSLKT